MIAQALVLAAGFGSRLTRHSPEPKPLVPFRGRRLIEWNLVWLGASGVRDVWINLHHEPLKFRSALGDGRRYGVRIRYSEEARILGTAGAWKRLRSEWRSASLVIYGDNVMRFDLGGLARAHATRPALCTVALFDVARHTNTGMAGSRVDVDRAQRVTAFREGGTGEGLVNAGAYVVQPELAERIADGFQDFGRDVFPVLAAAGELNAHIIEADGFCLGLDTPESFAVAQRLASQGRVRL
jgi:mannose-1-phosphate guanylyltransferase